MPAARTALLDQHVAESAAPLDLLLTQAAVRGGAPTLPASSALAFGRALASRPRRVLSRAGSLTSDLAKIAIGASDLAPSRRDRRFTDAAWTDNPVLRRLVQAYLAAARAAEGLAQDVPMDWRHAERVRFAVENLVEAMSPSNNPLTSPVAWKAAIDTGGMSAVRGMNNLVRDLAVAPRVPSMVDRDAFVVGQDLARSPGAVVLRTPVFELIQYQPVTETVHKEPLLVIPPTINKYYVLDLAPQRSLFEHLIASAQQVFVVSWRNPDARHSKWGFEVYVQAILDAMAATRDIASSDRTHVAAACSGGIIASMAASHLTQTGQADLLASLTLLVTVLDQTRVGTAGAFVDEPTAAAAIAASRRKGYLDGRQLSEIFAWLRPSDLVWNYVVNNYLQGKKPAAFDILAWNADSTRMTARLHADLLTMAVTNALVRPGAVSVLGSDVDLRRVETDMYVVAGVADHLCPWRSCYRSAQLFSGSTRFILSTSGHIAALVNPPGNPKSSYLVDDLPVDSDTDPQQWQAEASQQQGSWWQDYTTWLADRSGGDVSAPTALGSSRNRVLEAAPGSYVLDA